MFKGKPVRVVMVGDAKESIEKLNAIVQEELARGITASSSQTLMKSINQKIEILNINPEYGVHIPQDRIPKEYLLMHNARNLWKLNLSGAWRMIYTINGEEVDIFAFVIDILSHRTYEKKFGYKKS